MVGYTHHPLVIAHRGGSGLWPEQTLYAFEHAAAMGVDMLEMDVHSTGDGVLVLMHDDTVDRTTNGSGPITSYTIEALKALDAGYHWTTDGGRTFPFRGQGITVPTLEEVFNALPSMPMTIDIKQKEPSLIAPFCAMIRKSGMADKVIAASFSGLRLRAFRRWCPEVATSTTFDEVALFWLLSLVSLEAIYRPVFCAFQIPEYYYGVRIVTRRFVDAAHKRNLQVHVWTINEVDDMQRLLDLGVDGLITDYPDRVLRLLGR